MHANFLRIPLRGHRVGFRPMNCPFWMLGRGINRIQLQRDIPCVDQVVPGSCGNNDRITTPDFSLEIKILPAKSHPDNSLTLFNPKKLVQIRMVFQPDILPCVDAHQGKLQMVPRPQRGAKGIVLPDGLADIDDERFRAVIRKNHIVIPVVGARASSIQYTQLLLLPISHSMIRELRVCLRMDQEPAQLRNSVRMLGYGNRADLFISGLRKPEPVPLRVIILLEVKKRFADRTFKHIVVSAGNKKSSGSSCYVFIRFEELFLPEKEYGGEIK